MLKEFWFADRGETLFYKAARKMPFPPTFWTLLSFVPLVIGFACMWQGWLLVAAICYSVVGILDVADGIIARACQRCTARGAFLDGVVDRFSDFGIVTSFVFLPWPFWLIPQEWWVLLMVFFSFMPSFVVAYATHRKALSDVDSMKWRVLPRAERFILFIAVIFFAIFSATVSLVIALAALALCIATTLQSTIIVLMKSRTDDGSFTNGETPFQNSADGEEPVNG